MNALRTNPRMAAFIAAAASAVLGLVAIFSHGALSVTCEMLAILVWIGIGVGVAAHEQRNRSAPNGPQP